jgi:chlorobactene glucosyltransferase
MMGGILFVTLALVGIAMIAIVSAATFPRLGIAPVSTQPPPVSLLIPARNEAAVIGQTIHSLLEQTYPQFEVILLDDDSSDGTASIAHAAGQKDPRLKILTGAPLPPGWLGKNWACHQLAQAANGEWLIFTDADVSWTPQALTALAAEMSRTRAGLLAVWPTQQTVTWGERLVVPLMALAVIGYLPLPLVHHTPWASLAAATGQLLAFRREAYETIGGHAAVHDKIIEDVLLARGIKRYGRRLRLVDAAGLITCRMYSSWPEVRNGFAKNILAGYGDRVIWLALATVFHWLVFLGPWLWLALGWIEDGPPGWPVWPLILVGLGVGIRMLTAAVTRQRLGDALLMPLSVLLMTWIAIQAVWWRWRYGGPRWKGRTIGAPGS